MLNQRCSKKMFITKAQYVNKSKWFKIIEFNLVKILKGPFPSMLCNKNNSNYFLLQNLPFAGFSLFFALKCLNIETFHISCGLVCIWGNDPEIQKKSPQILSETKMRQVPGDVSSSHHETKVPGEDAAGPGSWAGHGETWCRPRGCAARRGEQQVPGCRPWYSPGWTQANFVIKNLRHMERAHITTHFLKVRPEQKGRARTQ